MKTVSPLRRRYFRFSNRISLRVKQGIFAYAAKFRVSREITENFMRSVPLWIASACVGGVAVLYASLFARAEAAGLNLVAKKPWLIFFLAPASFIAAWYCVHRFAPMARGSGIPQISAALEISGTNAQSGVERLLGLRVLVLKILSSCLLVFGGGAVGREGPTIQISGALFRFMDRITPSHWPMYSEKVLLLTGGAAGLAAAFNTPLGGIVFAIEELSKLHFSSFRTTLLTGVIISGFAAQMLLGPYLYLGYPRVAGNSLSLIWFVVLTAVFSGLAGAALSRLILGFLMIMRRLDSDIKKMIVAGMLGLAMACLAYFFSPTVLGSGKEIMVSLLFTGDTPSEYTMPMRFFGPLLSFISGGAGGIFAPALAGGASLGAVIAGAAGISPEQTNVLILTGMVGFLTGITRSPFTSAILVLEMTDRHSVIFYLMLASLIGMASAWFVSREPFYESLKKMYLGEVLDASLAKQKKSGRA
ncbi:MAG: chloride channel protein [Turneriella sp.]|nr:chloride channel protein [Turneriella sp.]